MTIIRVSQAQGNIMHNKEKTAEVQARIKELQKTEQDYANEIYYIFQNHRRSDLALPKKSICGKKLIPPGGTFKGDEYFMAFVKTGDMRLVQTVHPPYKPVNESTGENMEKLILDQPETFTREGKTENVAKSTPKQLMNDNNQNKNSEDVLLTENPMEGIEIIKG